MPLTLAFALFSNLPFLFFFIISSSILCILSFLLPMSISPLEQTAHFFFPACFPPSIPPCKMPYHDEVGEEEEEQEAREGSEEEEEEEEEEEQQEEEETGEERRHMQVVGVPSPAVVCLSCREAYTRRSAGTCRECYEEASETEEELKKEIEDLKARIGFLKMWATEAMCEGLTDMVLESSDGSKIRAHRAVLVSRSSVFKAMLENEMDESRRGAIKITDFSYEVLKIFMHYLYAAEVYTESLDECAYDLLALAEKYNVKHLKSVCEKFLSSKVNSDNALFIFEYANQHGAKALKQAALNAIVDHIHHLNVKDEYRDLVARDARLVVEIYEAYLNKQANSSS